VRFALILNIVFLSGITFAQTSEWGLSLLPSFSKGHLRSGVGEAYPGAPFWSGNLVIEERFVPAFSAEVFKEKISRFKNVSGRAAFGFSSCGSFRHYDYDYANSINNIVSIESRFHFLSISYTIKYNIPLKRMNLFAGLGPHLDYMIRYIETSENFVNGEFTQASFNFLSKEDSFNYGGYLALGLRHNRFAVECFYKLYFKPPVHHMERRIINYGLSISVYLNKKNKIK